VNSKVLKGNRLPYTWAFTLHSNLDETGTLAKLTSQTLAINAVGYKQTVS